MTDRSEVEVYDDAQGAIVTARPTGERISLRRLGIVQATSDVASDFPAGTWMLTDPKKKIPPQYIPKTTPLRFVPLLRPDGEIRLKSRTMWPYDPATGKPITGVDKPWCASQDGINPRQGQRDDFVGKIYTDYRPSLQDANVRNPQFRILPLTELPDGNIIGGCEKCPFGKFFSEYETFTDEEGKLQYRVNSLTGKKIVKRDQNGKEIRKGSPCRETPTYLFWLPDLDEIVVFQAKTISSLTSFRHLEDFFQPNKEGVSPQMADGQPHAILAKHYVKSYEGANKGHAHELSVDPSPLTDDEVAQFLSARDFIAESRFWDRLMGIGGDLVDDDELFADIMASQVAAGEAIALNVQLGKPVESRLGGTNDSPF